MRILTKNSHLASGDFSESQFRLKLNSVMEDAAATRDGTGRGFIGSGMGLESVGFAIGGGVEVCGAGDVLVSGFAVEVAEDGGFGRVSKIVCWPSRLKIPPPGRDCWASLACFASLKVAGFFAVLFRLGEGSDAGDAGDDEDGSRFGSSSFRLETGCSRSSGAGIETVFLELDGGEGSESIIVIGTRRRRVLLAEDEDGLMSRGVFCNNKTSEEVSIQKPFINILSSSLRYAPESLVRLS